LVFFAMVLFVPGAGGGVADQLRGHLGASGRRKVRVAVTGVCALPLSRRTLSIESRPRAAGAWGKKNNRRPGGRWRRGRPAMGSRRRGRARARARRVRPLPSLSHFPRARAARPPCHTPSRPHHCIIIENSTSSPLLAHLTRARVFIHHPAGGTTSYRVVLSREFSFFPFGRPSGL